MKKRLLIIQFILLIVSLMALFNMTPYVGVEAASGYKTNKAYIYANSTLAENMRSVKGSHTIEYKADTDTVRITATANNSDPHILIPLKDIGVDDEWCNQYTYLVLSYRASKSGKAQVFMSYRDGNDAEQGFAEYTSKRFDITPVPTNELADANTNSENNFATMKFNIASIPAGDAAGWQDAKYCRKIRLDCYDEEENGDWFEIDALAFCKTEDDAEYFIWERESVRNKHGKFEASKHMLTLFDNYHTCTGRYDETEKAIVFTMTSTDQSNNRICPVPIDHVGAGMKCNDYTHCAAFDPSVIFNIPGGLSSSKYKYMVLTYKAPDPNPDTDMFDDIIFSTKESDPVYYEFTVVEKNNRRAEGYVPIGVFPTTIDPETGEAKAIPQYERQFRITSQGEYFTSNILLYDPQYSPANITSIRIDPYNVHYANKGVELYISSIYFVQSLSEADDLIEDQLEDKYPYTYELKYDANAGVDNALVTNVPDTQTQLRTDKETYTFVLPRDLPQRPNYTFVGWSETPDGPPMLSVTEYTVVGIYKEKASKTLYAVWSENTVTIKYELSPPKEGLSGYASLSVTSQKVEVLADRPAGTVLTLTPGYKLEGWYDEGGQKVSTSLTFVPTKETYAWSERTYTARIIYETIQIGVSILDGKNYSSLGTSATSVDIVQNSAFTIELSLSNYYPNVHEELQIMNMTKTFPEYTKLLLIDITEPSNPSYYYYETKITDDGINLTDFISIIDNTTSYSDNQKAVKLTKKYLIIADFRTVSLDVGTYKIECVNNPITNEDTKPTLTINVGNQRSFEFNDNSVTDLTMSDKLNISYELTTTVGLGQDELYEGRSIAALVQLKDETNNEILFPEGTYITYNGNNYYPTIEGEGIIIPLGNISNKTINLSLNTPYQKLNEGNNSVTVSLYVSATNDADKPMGGEKLTTIETRFEVAYDNKAVSIEVNSSDSLFTKEEAESGISVIVKYTSNINKSEILLYVEKLENGNWVEVDNVLKGTISITDTMNIQLDSTKLSNMTTYRLVIKTTDNLVQDEALFIITE